MAAPGLPKEQDLFLLSSSNRAILLQRDVMLWNVNQPTVIPLLQVDMTKTYRDKTSQFIVNVYLDTWIMCITAYIYACVYQCIYGCMHMCIMHVYECIQCVCEHACVRIMDWYVLLEEGYYSV